MSPLRAHVENGLQKNRAGGTEGQQSGGPVGRYGRDDRLGPGGSSEGHYKAYDSEYILEVVLAGFASG